LVTVTAFTKESIDLQGIAHRLTRECPTLAVFPEGWGRLFQMIDPYFFPHFIAPMSPLPSDFMEDMECGDPELTGIMACAYGVFAHIK